tara:strand:- start:23631 stop:24284 length:654 start_codon:yes stop_codon:yes gene_type:complete
MTLFNLDTPKQVKTASSFRFKTAELGVFSTSETRPVLADFEKGVRLMGLSQGKFSLIDLIHGILKKTGPAHVACCTWSAGIKDAHQIKWMMDSDLMLSFKLLTDHSYSTRQKKYAVSIEDLFGKENIRTSETHAKYTLIHNEEFKVTVRTSMNLNANKTCETFEIDEDDRIFDFYMDFVEHTFGTMPKGFESSSFKANKSLNQFFSVNKNMQQWSEI